MNYQKDKVYPGLLNQVKAVTMVEYNNLTLEALEDYLFELSTSKLKKDDLPPVGYVVDGWYHIGGGCYTTEKGFKEFNKELKKLAKKSHGK